MIKRPFISLSYLILIFVFLTQSDIHSQTTQDDSKTIKQTKIDSLLDSKNYEEGIILIQKAISDTPETDYEALAKLYNKLSLCQSNTDKIDLSKKSAEKVLELSAIENNNPEEKAKAQYYIGTYHDRKSESTKALGYLRQSLASYSISNDDNFRGKAQVHLKIAQVFAKAYDYKIGNVHLDSAFTYLKKIKPTFFAGMGYYYFLAGNLTSDDNPDQAIENYTKAIEFYSKQKYPDWEMIGRINGNMASICLNNWEDEKALKYLAKSEKIYLREFGEDYYGNGINYQMYSVIYNNLGEYEKSLDYSNRALNLFKNIYGEVHPRVGLSYANIAGTYSNMRRYEEALSTYEKALAIFEKTVGEKHNFIFSSYGAIGQTHYLLKNYKESLKYLNKSIEVGNSIYGSNNNRFIPIYTSLGATLVTLKKDKEALNALGKALKIAQTSYEEKSKEVNGIYNEFANFHIENGQFDEALTYYNKVINSFKSENEEFLNTDNHTIEHRILQVMLTAIKGQGQCLFLKYKKYGDHEDLVASNSSFIQSELFLDKMRANVITPADRIELIANNQTARLGSVESFVQLEKQDKKQNYLEKAFLASERNKAGTLQDQIYRSSILELDEDIKKTRKFESNLKREKATILSDLKTKKNNPDKDTTQIETYNNKLFQLRKRNDSLLAEIQKNHPKYFAIEYAERISTVREIQSKLDANTTLLEYFEGDSTLYAFVITKNTFSVSEFPSTDLITDIEKFRTAVQNKDLDEFKKTSNGLYKNLIAPFAAEIIGKKLIVVPDGPIWNLNFDLLLTKQNNTKNPKDLPYLLNDYAISYANSASYLFGHPGQKIEPLEDCLAFSFSDSLNINVEKSISLNTLRNSKKDLPGSRLEISEISKIVEGDYYYGSNASEANFKKNASNYGILHLALHGEVDDEEPENSRLFFTQSKDSIEDGFLYGHELFAMNLPVELTVLSACSTGDGKIAPGEGMMSLGNAFQYAGSKSLLMTHWEVSDEISPQIMKLFYTNLKDGMDKATALQQAKISYLKDADVFRSDPFYWGSFYLVGETTPLSLGSSNWALYTFLGVLFIVVLLFFFRRRYFAKK